MAGRKWRTAYSDPANTERVGLDDTVRPVVEENHMYIRIASNDFFSVSQDVVSKMIAGEYSAAQAYKAFDSQLRESGDDSEETVKAFVEGCEGGFTPFNRGSLPVVSGIAMEVQEDHGAYTLTKVTRNGEAVRDEDTFTVTCLAAAKHMAPLLADESRVFEGGDVRVRNTRTEYVAQDDAVLAEPEPYISLR